MAPAKDPARLLTIALIVSEDMPAPDAGAIIAFADQLASTWEIVIVAHQLDPSRVRALTQTIREIPDATLHLVDRLGSDDLARLVALDVAIGDLVLVLDPATMDAELCRSMLDEIGQGYEVVIARPGRRQSQGVLYRALRSLFLRFYRRISGLRLEIEHPVAWAYTRQSALHLLSQREAEMLLKTSSLGPAFPGKAVVSHRERLLAPRRNRSPLARAWRALNRTSSLPLRSAVMLCLISAAANFGYMIYSFLSRFVFGNITPGWTSLSLQISGIFLILSIILAIIAEHLIEIDRAVNKRLRYRVLREVRSPLSRAEARRNIIGVD